MATSPESTAPSDAGPQSQAWKAFLLGITAILAAILLYISLHVGYVEDDKKEATQAIERFHNRLNALQFDAVYEDAYSELKNSQEQPAFTHLLRQVRDKFGAFQQADFSQVLVLMQTPIQVRAVYDSRFENGQVTESFTYVRQGKKLLLSSYELTPRTMEAKDLEVAQAAAAEFYKRMITGHYAAIWDASDRDLQKSISRMDAIMMFQNLLRNTGICAAPVLLDVDYASSPDGNFIGLEYHRRCQLTEVNERLAWRVVNGKALLRAYH